MMDSEDKAKLIRCAIVIALVILVFVALGRSASAGQASGGAVYLPHPAGCPKVRFCACGAAVEIFGRPIRSLWPSTAWFKFPKAAPAPNRVAVRRGHVFVLRQHIGGSIWLVADHNSGGGRSRLHQRSIASYTIVNPYTQTAEIR